MPVPTGKYPTSIRNYESGSCKNRQLKMSDDGMKIVGSVRDDKLYRSLDGGAVWNIINNDVKKWCGIFTLDFEVIYASVSDGGNIWKTDNGGGNC